MARNKKAPGYFQRRGKSIRWRVCVGGEYHAFTVKTTDRKEAEGWARRKYEELERQHGRRAEGLPVGNRLSDLLAYAERERLPNLAPGTQRTFGDSFKPIRAYFVGRLGDLALEQLRKTHVADFLDWRRQHGPHGERLTKRRHGRTIAKDRAVLHWLFAIAEELEWRDGNPVANVRVPKADSRQYIILSGDQYQRLLREVSDPMCLVYVLFCGETGARCESEALWLEWGDVDFEDGFVTIVSGRNGHRTKGGRTRVVPMTRRLAEAMRAHFARFRFAVYESRDGEHRPAHVFHHTETRRHYGAGDRVHSFRAAIRSAAQRARLPAGWVMHDLRHRRATTWLAEGKSPVLVKEALGHADLRTTMEYTHLAKEHLRALIEPVAGERAQAHGS